MASVIAVFEVFDAVIVDAAREESVTKLGVAVSTLTVDAVRAMTVEDAKVELDPVVWATEDVDKMGVRPLQEYVNRPVLNRSLGSELT